MLRISYALATFALGLAIATPADARSPARHQCVLSKSESKQAIEQAKQKFPEMGKPVVTGCRCVSGCMSLNVTMRPVEIAVKEHDITFELRTSVSIPRKSNSDSEVVTLQDEEAPIDFTDAAAFIRKQPATKALFGDGPLVCDAREKYGSFRIACATSDPKTQLSGGRPGHGAVVLSVQRHPNGWKRATFAGPVDAMERAADKRWKDVRKRDDVKAFLAKHGDVTVSFMFREVNLHGPYRARLSVRTEPGW